MLSLISCPVFAGDTLQDKANMDCSIGDTSPLPEGKSPSPRLCWGEVQEPSPLPEPTPDEMTPTLLLTNEATDPDDSLDDNLMLEDVSPEEAEQVELALVAELPAASSPEVTSQAVVQDDIVLVDMEGEGLCDLAPEVPVSQDLTSSEAPLLSPEEVLTGIVKTTAMVEPALGPSVEATALMIQANLTPAAAAQIVVSEVTLNRGDHAFITVPSQTSIALVNPHGRPNATRRRFWRIFGRVRRRAPTLVGPAEESSGCFPFRQMLRRLFKINK